MAATEAARLERDWQENRGLAYAPYADLLWCETAHPHLAEARRFAEAIHQQYPGKLLSYNCSPSFNWKRNLDEQTIAGFQREVGAGYFDQITQMITQSEELSAVHGSTEEEQFEEAVLA